MAQISPQHSFPITCGAIGLLVVAALGLAFLNKAANR